MLRQQGARPPLCLGLRCTEQEQRYQLKNPCLGVQALCALAKVCLPLMAEEWPVQVSSGFVRAANTEALLEIAAGIDDVPVVVTRRDLLGEVSEEQPSPGPKPLTARQSATIDIGRCTLCNYVAAPVRGQPATQDLNYG